MHVQRVDIWTNILSEVNSVYYEEVQKYECSKLWGVITGHFSEWILKRIRDIIFGHGEAQTMVSLRQHKNLNIAFVFEHFFINKITDSHYITRNKIQDESQRA